MDGPDADDRQDTAGRAGAANGPEAAGRAGAAGPGNPGERPNRNVARGEATRGQLVAIATRMFAERGYEDTSIEAVLREAGVSRGSLYHHFASKEALFEAVAEEVETSVGAQTVAAASGSERVQLTVCPETEQVHPVPAAPVGLMPSGKVSLMVTSPVVGP